MYENFVYFLILKNSFFELKGPQNCIILKSRDFYYFTVLLQPMLKSNKT